MVAIALGGDWLADIAVLRAQPKRFGPVASNPTVSRLLDALAAQPEQPPMLSVQHQRSPEVMSPRQLHHAEGHHRLSRLGNSMKGFIRRNSPAATRIERAMLPGPGATVSC